MYKLFKWVSILTSHLNVAGSICCIQIDFVDANRYSLHATEMCWLWHWHSFTQLWLCVWLRRVTLRRAGFWTDSDETTYDVSFSHNPRRAYNSQLDDSICAGGVDFWGGCQPFVGCCCCSVITFCCSPTWRMSRAPLSPWKRRCVVICRAWVVPIVSVTLLLFGSRSLSLHLMLVSSPYLWQLRCAQEFLYSYSFAGQGGITTDK